MCFVVTCWERADLLALVCGVFCEFVTFPLVSWVRCGTWLYRFLIFAPLLTFSYRWCKRENVEPDALKEWKINIFKIIDTRISFYYHNTHLLPPKPKSSFRHLKRGIQDFHMNYVLVPADKGANNVVVVWRFIIFILLSVSLLTLMPINCSLLWVRGWLLMGMVVIQPYILVSKLTKIKTKFLRCTGYLNSIKTL